MHFQKQYVCLDAVVVCEVLHTTTAFSKERDIYKIIQRLSQAAGWKFIRVDTESQMGFPDVLLLKKDTYWQIEAKQLKNKKLVSLEDNLQWEFGQIAYMTRSIALGLNYMLAVSKGNQLAFIKGVSNDKRECSDYPDFIRQF